MSSSRISEKIRKLLAIVEDPAASEVEKATALSKAASLARRHELNMEDCRDAADRFDIEQIATFRRLPPYFEGIGDVLVFHFDVRVLTCGSPRHGYTIEIFGSESSRAVAVYVWTYLRREFLRCFRAYKARNPLRHITAAAERGYFESLAIGLRAALLEARKTTATAADENAMILVSDELDSKLADRFRKLGTGRRRDTKRNAEAVREGFKIRISPALNTERKAPRRIGTAN